MNTLFTSEYVLYYPTIEFQSETWVKAALTFWNKIYRIVPPYYKPKDTKEIREAVAGKFIENIELTEEDLRETADNFMFFCESLFIKPAGFESNTYQVRLHGDKIDQRLKPFFKEFANGFDANGFYHIPATIANGYMFYLSDTISRRRNFAKLTDSRDMYAAMTYFDVDGNIGESIQDSGVEETYTNLMIENLIPKDIRSMKMETVLKICEDLRHEKDEFRNIVSEFSSKINKIQDPSFAEQEIRKFQSRLTENRLTRKEFMQKFTQNLVPSVLFVGIPTLATSLVGSVFSSKDDVFGLAEIFLGVAIAGVASIGAAGANIVKDWNPNYSNYFLELKNHLTSAKKSNLQVYDISKLLNEYVND